MQLRDFKAEPSLLPPPPPSATSSPCCRQRPCHKFVSCGVRSPCCRSSLHPSLQGPLCYRHLSLQCSRSCTVLQQVSWRPSSWSSPFPGVLLPWKSPGCADLHPPPLLIGTPVKSPPLLLSCLLRLQIKGTQRGQGMAKTRNVS